jgi:hypothetical protein
VTRGGGGERVGPRVSGASPNVCKARGADLSACMHRGKASVALTRHR